MNNLRIALWPVLVSITIAVCPVAQAQTAQHATYPDVPEEHWAFKAIDKLSQSGIIEGNPDGNFNGDGLLTRYEFTIGVARLWAVRLCGPSAQGVSLHLGPQRALLARDIKPLVPFRDVPHNHWAYNAVKAVQEAGIMEGDQPGHFQGDKPITRYEYAVAIERMQRLINTRREERY